MTASNGDLIRLIALDFGTTTSKALESTAVLTKNAVTGRMEIRSVTAARRSEPVFTPFDGDRIDEERIVALVDEWLAGTPAGFCGAAGAIAGGVIITGLAAKKENARAIAAAVRNRLGGAVVAAADDPCQESWLAFMGSCSGLSSAHPKLSFLNLDIGGGTTNSAFGVNNSVLATGSCWIGARHFRFEPGTYKIEYASSFAQRILAHFKLKIGVCGELNETARDQVLQFYISVLENRVAASGGQRPFPWMDQEKMHFPRQHAAAGAIVTFSGGVGELVYRLAAGEDFPVTPFGDLGVDLARAILRSTRLARHLQQFQPENLGRATVCGLAFHGTEVSGTTVFLRDKSVLPLLDVPLVGRISAETGQEQLNRLLARGKSSEPGISLVADLGSGLAGLQRLAARVSHAIRKNRFAEKTPLIIFTPQNLGKTFGQYVTAWGRLKVNLMVIDEIDVLLFGNKAYLASVSDAGGANMLVSFYGGLSEAEGNRDAQDNTHSRNQSPET